MRYFWTAFLIILCIHSNGQGTYDVFYSVDDALESRSQYIELDLSNQGLVHLPQRVFQIVNLRSINLSNNPLLDVSTSLDSLNQFQYLETIKLNNLNLKYFPFELYGLTKLKYLHIEKNQIETLPDEIKSMYSLKGLYVNDNKIDYIQPGFMHLSKLEVIDLRQNGDYDSKSFLYFSSLMKSLKHLKIDCDKGLNEELVSLTNLKELTLYKPYIDKNYELFGSLNNLEELTIEKGVLVNYHQLFISMPESNLKKLSISDNAIVQLDDAIVNLKKLEYLSVSSWNLNSFPESISSHQQLKEVEFYDAPNMIDEKTLGYLNSEIIQSIEIIDCNRKIFPKEINRFTNLNKLDLSKNELSSFNDFSSQSLKELIFYDNEISELEINLLKARMPNCNFEYENEREIEPATLSVKNVQPPVKEMDIPFQTYKVDTQNPSKIEYLSGSTINIPENAFLDKDGKIVKGKVDLTYREFNDPLEIVFSGIPMGYDSSGVVYPFQSSGMMEIRASQNGQELYTNPESPITVNMVSNNSSSIFNLYSMEDGEEWQLKGKDSVSSNDGSPIINNRFIYNDINSIVPMPVIPVVKSGVSLYMGTNKKRRNKGYIKIYSTNYNQRLISFMGKSNMDYKSFSELKEFNRFDWKLDGLDLKAEVNRFDSLREYINEFNDKMSAWRNVAGGIDTITQEYKLLAGANLIEDLWVEPNFMSDNFLLKILVCGDTNTFQIVPLINTSNPKSIQKKFKFIYSKYDKAYKARKEKWSKVDEFHGDYLGRYREEMEKYQNDIIEYNKNRDAYLAKLRVEVANYAADSYNFTRSFSIDGFGFWNCDVIKRMSAPQPLLAKFYDKEQNKLNVLEIMIADITNNGVLRYDTRGKRVYDSKSKNAIIAFLPGGKIGLLTPDEVESTKLFLAEEKAMLEVYNSKEISIGDIKKKIGMPIN